MSASPSSSEPYIPIQQRWAECPWRVLVCCIMLNLTSRTQVIPIIDGLFERWPTPEAMAAADGSLDDYITPCGLQKARAERLRRMSAAFPKVRWLSPASVQQLPGCGMYAAEAFRVFVQGDLDEQAQDIVLTEWVERRRVARRLRDRG